MGTLTERAEEYAKRISPNNEIGQIVRFTAYHIGARDERKIVIKEVCEWIEQHNEEYYYTDDWGHTDIEFSKMLEDLEKYLNNNLKI